MIKAKKLFAVLTLAAGACCPPATTVTPMEHPTPVPAPSTGLATPNEAHIGPPRARREAVVDTLHGVKVADPYRWLEDGKSREVKQWLMMHDAHTRVHLHDLPQREWLTKRLTELSYLESISPPSRKGKRFFFSRRHKDKEKTVYYWREGKTGKPKVLLDPNTMSADGSVSIRSVAASFDGKWVAYKKSENNSDEATMHVMDVATGKVSEIDRIDNAKYAWAEWEPKGTGFYYVSLPPKGAVKTEDRPGEAQIHFHKLGTAQKDDYLVHDKTGDPQTFVGPEISRDGNFLFFYKWHGWAKNDLFFKDLRKDDPKDPNQWRKFAVGHDAKFSAYAWKGRIYVRTNLGAPKFKLYQVDPDKPEMSAWKEIVPEKKDAVLDGFSVLGDHLALSYMVNASSRVDIANLDGKVLRTIELPGIGSVHGPSGNPEDDTAYYGFSSYTTPTTVYETSIKSGESKSWFELEVPVDPTPFTVEQVWYESKDKTKISMFIVRRKDMPRDGSTPVLLTGYGGFNISYTPSFVATYFPLLEKGGAVALPNLRGGGEYGEEWHKAGMLGHKQNVFDDFIGAAQYLFDKGYTKPERLAIRGASNGGLLVGAAMVQRPDMFKAVICGVPLLDMVRYHKFESGKTWIGEYGSADDADAFTYLHAYSPYHHVTEGTTFPSLLMLTADSDDRVDPNHARKFMAAVRWANRGDNHLLLRVETNSGHGGGDMVNKHVEEWTDIYAFMFDELGMNEKN